MKYTKEDIINKLEGYTELKCAIKQLQYEMDNIFALTGDEVIEAMTFSKRDGEHVMTGCISDKTLRIALNYSETRDALLNDRQLQLRAELVNAKMEVERLEHYINLLEEKQAAVLRSLYFEGSTWRDAQEKLNISSYSFPKYRNAGIKRLTEMFNRLP